MCARIGGVDYVCGGHDAEVRIGVKECVGGGRLGLVDAEELGRVRGSKGGKSEIFGVTGKRLGSLQVDELLELCP